MTQKKGLQIVLAARPQGKVRLDDFRLEEFTSPEPGPGEFLMKVDYLSLDPYMRGRMDDRKSYAEPSKIGAVMQTLKEEPFGVAAARGGGSLVG